MAGATHIGHTRSENQDRLLLARLTDDAILAAVADGIGGHAGGSVAAQIAVDALRTEVVERAAGLEAAFKSACRAVEQAAEASADMPHMGSTLTGMLVGPHGLAWAHLGDTRLYLLREGALRRLTRDDTAAEELVASGQISEEEARSHPARHMLFECLGCGDCEPAMGRRELLRGDLLMICSDGLHGEVSDTGLAEVLSGGGPLEDKAEALVAAALTAGGRDNITVVLVQV